MKKLRIGITIGLKSTDESIWTNGMKQNVLFLYKLLSHSVKNYDVWILNTTNLDLTEKPHAFKDVNIASLKDKHEEIDLLICMGSQVEQKYMEYFQNHPDKKVVGYRCGNNYILAVEEMLFNNKNDIIEFEKEFDNYCKEYPEEITKMHQEFKKNKIIIKDDYNNKIDINKKSNKILKELKFLIKNHKSKWAIKRWYSFIRDSIKYRTYYITKTVGLSFKGFYLIFNYLFNLKCKIIII